MCGIIGYNGNKNAKDVIISGLKNLEYRGYDSAGICVIENGNIDIYKSVGRIKNLEEKISDKNIDSKIGIGHTRWATHGIPSEDNAHPHRHGKVTLVHNGIIENYIELKQQLIKENVEFYSNTDTEVACGYINYLYEKSNNKLESISKACKIFRGSYAFGIIFDDDKETLYAARKDSPLVIGIGEKENFITSDISAILNYTNKYILLDNLQFAKITKNDVTVFNSDLESVNYTVNTADFKQTENQKGNFEHFMLKEIYEQPRVISDVFRKYINKSQDVLNIYDFSKYDHIDIVACGSAMHAGLIGKYFLENFANIKTDVEIASEYRYKKHIFSKNSLVIVISQSGETADTLAALRLAKENDIFVLAIVNTYASAIARESDACIYTCAGAEIAVATTKGYTTQVAALATLAVDIANKKGLNNNFKKNYNSYEEIITKVISKRDLYLDVANKIYNSNNIFFIGRGIDYAVTMEGSLKLKEISYIHSESYAAGELKHGTISLIENGTPVIAIATDEKLIEKTISNIKEVKARGAYTIFITTEEFKNINTQDFADITIYLPETDILLNPIISVIALQLVAYEVANLKGCDIDKPKNLAKSVTVE